ncbi:MAG: hypothetical protein EU530_09160 [Promethearchaeota archaeon]|nr:MAG: hypothetical protein EU530_09160 [Candidatus Lokiarchaeota archaeon]
MKKRIILALAITITSLSGLLLGTYAFYSIRLGYFFKGKFSEPVYALPTGSHFNSDLDNSTLINQTILSGLEEALWAFTLLQRAGGFPLGSKIDGSFMWSDRGTDFPLFPREFSIQEGTPLIGSVFLSMYQIEPNPIYLSVAKEAADALLAIQDENGGFYYEGRRHKDGTGYDPHPWNPRKSTILDDNVMQSCMSYLLDIYNETEEMKYYLGFDKAITCLNSIELPYGAWKQRSNYPDDAYQSQATLNDNVLYDVVIVLLKAHSMFPSNPNYLNAAIRAGDFLLNTQGNGGSTFQQGWAQQYNLDLEPCWARDFEPPAICSLQTATSIQILMELYLTTNDAKWLNPIPNAIAWLNSTETKLDGLTWARLYELKTNTPIYGIENGKDKKTQYVYNVEDARPGYSWQGPYGILKIIEQYQQLENFSYSIPDYFEWKNESSSIEDLEQVGYSLIQNLSPFGFWVDDDGPWMEEGQIISSTFAGNAFLILQYLVKALS